MPRDVKKMCEHCQGTGQLCTPAGILIVTGLGRPRQCHLCQGKGFRVFEEFTQQEFNERFPRGLRRSAR